MLPPVGCSKPPIIRSVVVLPQPEGPRSEKNSPGSIDEVDVVDGDEVAELLAQAGELDPTAVIRVGIVEPGQAGPASWRGVGGHRRQR